MGKGNSNITKEGLKLIGTILIIAITLLGAHKGYVIYSETVKRNTENIKKIEPKIHKNEKDIIRFNSKLDSIDKRQERIENKIDIVIERMPRR